MKPKSYEPTTGLKKAIKETKKEEVKHKLKGYKGAAKLLKALKI
jgi:hypothetical protein